MPSTAGTFRLVRLVSSSIGPSGQCGVASMPDAHSTCAAPTVPRGCHRDTPLKDRLLARRHILTTGCWIWTGAVDRYGYGKVKFQGQLLKVHRASMHVFKGMRLDAPCLVCHSCDVPACFNPDHLREGTYTDNIRDKWLRRRQGVTWDDSGKFISASKAPPSDLPF